MISSTSEDLGPYRAATRDVLLEADCIPEMMEYASADPRPIVEMCRQWVAQADVILMIQAYRRGWVPRPEQGGDGETSITGHELRTADDLRKPVLVFLATQSWPGYLWETDQTGREWVSRFREQVGRGVSWFDYEPPPLETFKSKVRNALIRYQELRARQGISEPWTQIRDFDADILLRPLPEPVQPDSPYPLLEPYSHPATFGGREIELQSLETLVRRPGLVVCVYAASGAGKTSLLRAGLAPALRANGFRVSIEGAPGEPGLAHRLISDLLHYSSSLQFDDSAQDTPIRFRALLERVGRIANGHQPILIIDQVDDMLRDRSRDTALAQLGPLMAATAGRMPGGGFCCRWVLSYRHEFHGEVVDWLRDILRQARAAGKLGLEQLPHDLSDPDRRHEWSLPPFGAPLPGEDELTAARRSFLDAINRPLRLRRPDGSRVFPLEFTEGGADALAEAFARARVREPAAPLVPELQVVLAHLMQDAISSRVVPGLILVPQDPVELDRRIIDALADHLRIALEYAFPAHAEQEEEVRRRRTQAILALDALADSQGRRGVGLPQRELIKRLGDGGESVLDILAGPEIRLVLRQPDGPGYRCILTHDRIAEVVRRFVRERAARFGINLDERLLTLRRFVTDRAAIYALDPNEHELRLSREQFKSLYGSRDILLLDESQRRWWEGCLVYRAERTRRIQDKLIGRLGSSSVPALERVISAERLAILGDRRMSAAQWWLPNDHMLGFVEIDWPASDITGPNCENKHSPRAECGSIFLISRWPVTVAQFRAFVEDSDGSFEPTDARCLSGVTNRPVVWVSSDEALAYCRWLTSRLRSWPSCPRDIAGYLHSAFEITLPTERQWEGVAGGADSRRYAWGDEIDPDRVNYGETRIGAPSPVGCFPGGATPEGVEDLCGNVWEWTRSIFSEDRSELPDKYLSNYKGLVVRGGSYEGDEVSVGVKARYFEYPHTKDRDLGFRTAISIT